MCRISFAIASNAKYFMKWLPEIFNNLTGPGDMSQSVRMLQWTHGVSDLNNRHLFVTDLDSGEPYGSVRFTVKWGFSSWFADSCWIYIGMLLTSHLVRAYSSCQLPPIISDSTYQCIKIQHLSLKWKAHTSVEHNSVPQLNHLILSIRGLCEANEKNHIVFRVLWMGCFSHMIRYIFMKSIYMLITF